MSDWAMEKARKIAWNDILGYSLETTHNAEVIATALREAEARGRASMKEDAAKEEGTVSDIPDEIMIAANECHLFTFNRGYRQSVEAIARALMAERKRALEDAAKVATSFLVGDPFNGVPLRRPTAHEIAEAILALS